jgi:hypothetical protein
MFEYFYHEILRRTVISFGSLFNEITIKKKQEDGDIFSSIKVPLSYGPTQKFLARIEQSPNLNRPVQITLPRMSFEMVGITYDSQRKVTTTQSFLAKSTEDSRTVSKSYMPVPYNVEFELAIMTKLNDDMLQIIEQILPYFQPSYTLTVDLVDQIGEKRDIPIILNNISMQDDYEGDFSTRRVLIHTLRFTAKTYLFGPVNTGISKDLIKKVSIGYLAGDSNSYNRGLTYSITPTATKNYTGLSNILLTQDIDSSTTKFTVNTADSIPNNSYLTIDEETFYVKKIELNPDTNLNDTIVVDRSQYDTTANSHVSGSKVFLITQQDNNLIEPGDDFGFSVGF